MNITSEYNKGIIQLIAEYNEEHPGLRFGQILHNLGINEFADKENPSSKEYLLRDIHSDVSSDIYHRVKKKLE